MTTRQRKFDLNRFRSAVMTRARMRARTAVEAELRARGLKPQDYTYAVLVHIAESYVAAHTEQMITQAAQDVAKFPEFARHLLAHPDFASVRKDTRNRTLAPQQQQQAKANQQ